ncbi:MAG: hybrid sensor histidine kinase/response regulator [Betaproteobacteria bacterium]|nr:hybrid sensor histidine kinase/response regulator [Betaproteobacteria bacterium]
MSESAIQVTIARPTPAGVPARGEHLSEQALRLRVQAEQIRMLFTQSPVTSVGALAAALLLAWMMAGRVELKWVLAWLLTLNVVQVARFWLHAAWRRRDPPEHDVPRWGRHYTVAIATAGVCWAAGALVLFVPGDLAWQAVLAMVYFGLAAGAFSATCAWLPALYVIVPLLLAPLALRLALEGGQTRIIMAVLAGVLLATLLAFGRNQNHAIAASIRHRFENLDLIGELRLREAAAEQAREQAEQANRAKSRFLAAASHDLRQPLQALGLFTAALAGASSEAQRDRTIGYIGRATQALEELFGQLLDISRLDAGFIQAEAVAFDLGTVLEKLRTGFAPAALEKGLRFSIIGGSGEWVRSDAVLVERILSNLVANAVRYTREGQVVVGCYAAGPEVCVEVSDTGVGIAAEDQKHVFEEFYQVGNPERDRTKGLGLGLAIVRRLVEILDLRLTMTSAPGHGTRFRLMLPAGEPSQGAAPAVEAVGDEDFPGLKVLVVDDEADVREGMVALLQQWGCEAGAVGSIDEALRVLPPGAAGPDLLIADYRLRGGDRGTEAIDAVRLRCHRHIPAFLISGDTAIERLQEVKRSGYAMLHKPFSAQRLRDQMRAMLAGAEGGVRAG